MLSGEGGIQRRLWTLGRKGAASAERRGTETPLPETQRGRAWRPLIDNPRGTGKQRQWGYSGLSKEYTKDHRELGENTIRKAQTEGELRPTLTSKDVFRNIQKASPPFGKWRWGVGVAKSYLQKGTALIWLLLSSKGGWPLMGKGSPCLR